MKCIYVLLAVAVSVACAQTLVWQTTLSDLAAPAVVNGAPFTIGNLLIVWDEWYNINAIDINSGVVAWQNNVSGGIGGYLVGSPDGKYVGFASAMGQFSSIDARTGALLWNQSSFQPISVSGIVGTNKALVVAGSQSIIGYDFAMGFIAWENTFCNSVIAIDGDSVLLQGQFGPSVNSSFGLAAVNSVDGKIRWTYPQANTNTVSGVVFPEGIAVAVSNGATGQSWVYLLDKFTGKQRLNFPTMNPGWTGVASYQDGVFCMLTAFSYVSCVDASQGFTIVNMSLTVLNTNSVSGISQQDGVLILQLSYTPPSAGGAPNYLNWTGVDMVSGNVIYTFTPPTLSTASFTIVGTSLVIPFAAGYNVFNSRTGVFKRRTTTIDGVLGVYGQPKGTTIAIVRENWVYGYLA